MERQLLHWSDYVVFVASLVASLTVGVYHGVKNRRRQTTEAYLMANRSVQTHPNIYWFHTMLKEFISFIFVMQCYQHNGDDEYLRSCPNALSWIYESVGTRPRFIIAI